VVATPVNALQCGGKDGESAHDLSLNVGLQASVGAKITLKMGFWAHTILDWVQPSVVIGSTKMPVKSGCLLQDGSLVKRKGFIRGSVYHGTQKLIPYASDFCKRLYKTEEAKLTFQLINPSDENSMMDFVGAVSDALVEGQLCVSQTKYLLNFKDAKNFEMMPDYLEDVSYTGCQNDNATIASTSYTGSFTENGMTGYSYDNCMQFSLEMA